MNAPDSKSHAERVIVIAIIKKKEHEGKMAAFQPNRTPILTCIHTHTYVDVYQHIRARSVTNIKTWCAKRSERNFTIRSHIFVRSLRILFPYAILMGIFFHFIKQDPL